MNTTLAGRIAFASQFEPVHEHLVAECWAAHNRPRVAFLSVAGKRGAALELQHPNGLLALCRSRDAAIRSIKADPFRFTVRTQERSARLSEYDRVVSGWGQWLSLVHGIIQPTGAAVVLRCFVLDLDIFRRHLATARQHRHDNGDGTAYAEFNMRDFPPDILLHYWRDPRLSV